jgi:hypothetical protein
VRLPDPKNSVECYALWLAARANDLANWENYLAQAQADPWAAETYLAWLQQGSTALQIELSLAVGQVEDYATTADYCRAVREYFVMTSPPESRLEEMAQGMAEEHASQTLGMDDDAAFDWSFDHTAEFLEQAKDRLRRLEDESGYFRRSSHRKT